jgi:hypothetical protein
LNEQDFGRWIDRIYSTSDVELTCDEIQPRLAAYVDAQVSGISYNGKDEKVRQHLRQCSDCYEVFTALVEVVELDGDGALPALSTLLATFPAPTPEPEREKTGV